MLLSNKPLSDEVTSDSDPFRDLCDPTDSDLDPDPGVDRDEVKYKRERGFYDVGMLNVDTVTLCNETLKRLLSDTDDLNYLLHPDVKIEVLMAEQRKHMRIAQLLKLSQPPPEPLHPLQIVRPPSESEDGKEMPVPPNTPRLAKLKPDHCWIKEIPDSPEVPSDDVGSSANLEHDGNSVDAAANSSHEELDSSVEVKASSDQSERVKPEVIDHAHAQRLDSETSQPVGPETSAVSDSVSESGSDVSRNDQAVAQHYIKDDIPWHPGTCLLTLGVANLAHSCDQQVQFPISQKNVVWKSWLFPRACNPAFKRDAEYR